MRYILSALCGAAALIVSAPASAQTPVTCNPTTGVCGRYWTDADGAWHVEIVENGEVVSYGVFERDGDAHGNNPLYGGDWTTDGVTGIFKSPRGSYCTRFGCGAPRN